MGFNHSGANTKPHEINNKTVDIQKACATIAKPEKKERASPTRQSRH